jgi:hypothetical protein
MQTRFQKEPLPASSAPQRKALAVGAALLAGAFSAHAAGPENFTKLKFTEVVENVTVLEARSEKSKPATVNSVLNVPDRVATGPNSRAELLAPDGTVTRVGASTIFSFSAEKREVNLQKGSVLFHSPTGKGGGVIRTNGAQAAVMGTTLIVTATSGGGFKLLVLEGKAKATLTNGSSVNVTAGQLTLVEPGRPTFGPVLNFRLKEQVAGSALLKGFQAPVASEKKVLSSVDRQERMIEKGRAEPTRFRVRGDKLVEGGEQPPPQKERFVRGDTQRPPPVPKGTLDASADLIGTALKQDVLVQELGKEPASSLFTFTKPPTEKALAPVLGLADLEALSATLSKYADKDFQLLLSRNLTVAGARPFPDGDLSDYLFPSSPWQVKILAANGALLLNEDRGLNSILDSATLSTALPTALPATESLLWVAAKDSITVTRSSLQATADLFRLGSTSPSVPVEISLTESNLINRSGGIDLQANKIETKDTSLLARGNISIDSRTDISIENTKGRELTAGLPGSSLKITALRDLTINSLATPSGPGNTTKLNAQNISLEARTLVLKDIDFKAGSTVLLSSSLGTLAAAPNTNKTVEALKVNFISGVKYGGELIPSETTSSTLKTGDRNITLKANGRL